MKTVEQGFLLLTSHLGDMKSNPLTTAQFRTLLMRVKNAPREDPDRELELRDLTAMGYDSATGERILFLLSRQEQMQYYVEKGKRLSCTVVTRSSRNYPAALRLRLGTDCPGCLWLKGNADILCKPAVALVGSRELPLENETFAREVGRQAALQGFALLSGNARGADRAAQDSCLENGGFVISIVADRLQDAKPHPRILYISEDGYDCDFSTQRAHSRNRLIHSMGMLTLVARSSLGKGGTWSGCVQNLRNRYSPVFCFQDGSQAAEKLMELGAVAVDIYDLSDYQRLKDFEITLFDT